MRFHVVTLFPELIDRAVSYGVVGQALQAGLLSIATVNPRSFTTNVHQTIDDRPFGGGDGMIMMAEPLAQAVTHILPSRHQGASRSRVIHLSPRGQVLNDAKVRELASYNELVLIASRYGGADQRFLNEYVDEELSLGDFVMSGGELGALVVIDVVARQIPGVLGNESSACDESFAGGRGLEYPQYTRPREWHGTVVPEALLSGHHKLIEEWKRDLSILVTADRRLDLLMQISMTSQELSRVVKTLDLMTEDERKVYGLTLSRETLRERLLNLKARSDL